MSPPSKPPSRPAPHPRPGRRPRPWSLLSCVGLAVVVALQSNAAFLPPSCPLGHRSALSNHDAREGLVWISSRSKPATSPYCWTAEPLPPLTRCHVARVGDQARSSSEARQQAGPPPPPPPDESPPPTISASLRDRGLIYHDIKSQDDKETEGTGGGVTASMFRERGAEDEERRRRRERSKTRDVMMQALEDRDLEELDLDDSILEGYVSLEKAPPPEPSKATTTTTTTTKKKSGGGWLSSVWRFVTGAGPAKKKKREDVKGSKSRKKTSSSAKSVSSTVTTTSQVADSGVRGEEEGQQSIVKTTGVQGSLKKKGVKKKKMRRKGEVVKAKGRGGFGWWGLVSLFKGEEASPRRKKKNKAMTVEDAGTVGEIKAKTKMKDKMAREEEKEEVVADFEFYGLSPVLSPREEVKEAVPLLPAAAPDVDAQPEAKKDEKVVEKKGSSDWWGLGSLFGGRKGNETVTAAVQTNATQQGGGGFDWWGLARSNSNRAVNATMAKNKTTTAIATVGAAKKEVKEGDGDGFDWWGLGSLFSRGANATTEMRKANMSIANGTRSETGGGFDWWGLFGRKGNATVGSKANMTTAAVNGTRQVGGGFDWWGLFKPKVNNGTDMKGSAAAVNMTTKGEKSGGSFDWWGLGSVFNRGSNKTTEAKKSSSWVAPEDESDYYRVEGKEGPSSWQRQVGRFFDGVGRFFRPEGNSTAMSPEEEEAQAAAARPAPSPLSPFAGAAPMLGMLRNAWQEQWGGGARDLAASPGEKPRADDLVKLPKNFEEVVDLFADDTRYIINSVAQLFTPPAPMRSFRRPVAKGAISRPVEPPKVLEAPPLASPRFRDDDEPSESPRRRSLEESSSSWTESSSSSRSFRSSRRRRRSEPLAHSTDEEATETFGVDEEERAGEDRVPGNPFAISPYMIESEDTAQQPALPTIPPPKAKESKRVVVASWLSGVVGSMKPTDRAALVRRRRLLSERIPRKMNDRFLRTVSRKLQNDRLKIKEFQLQTDRFRNSLITGQAYYDSVLSLFGSLDDADEILFPLMDTLPEPAKRRELMDVYAARRRRGFESLVDAKSSGGGPGWMAMVGSVIGASTGAITSLTKSVVSAVVSRSSKASVSSKQKQRVSGEGEEEEEEEDDDEEDDFWPESEDEEEQDGAQDLSPSDEMGRDELKAVIWERVVMGQRADFEKEGVEEQQQVEVRAGGKQPQKDVNVKAVPASVSVKPKPKPKPTMPAAEREAKKRQVLGERNIAYFNLRLDLYRRSAISAVDFYRSLKNFVPPGESLDDIVDLLIEEDMLEDKRKARYIQDLHQKSLGSVQ